MESALNEVDTHKPVVVHFAHIGPLLLYQPGNILDQILNKRNINSEKKNTNTDIIFVISVTDVNLIPSNKIGPHKFPEPHRVSVDHIG